MAESSEDAKDIEKLYEYGERLNQDKDKSQHADDYANILAAVKSSSVKARQLAAQLIPRFFKYFADLSANAVDAHLDLCEAEELGIRVQAIRGLPLFCRDTPEHLTKIVDILAQLLNAEENVERDAVSKALLSLLRQDAKASLEALFKHIESVDEQMIDENFRERILLFVKDKVFPLKDELLKPTEKMERHITDLIKKCLQDVTGAEFKMFMDFLKSLNLFGEKAPLERVQELIELIEEQADMDAQLNVADGDHIDRLISCMFMALPFFERGASNSKFYCYLNKHMFPVFDKLPDERKIDLLKNLAESSPYTSSQDSRHILPAVVLLLKECMPRRKTVEEMNFTSVECLLYTFHHLAHKAPNAINSLCGYKIVTGQPSDRLGENFSDQYKDFTERLNCVGDLVQATMQKLTLGMADHNKALTAAVSDEAKASIKMKKLNTTTGLRTCKNILAMTQVLRGTLMLQFQKFYDTYNIRFITQPLLSKTPSFIGDKSISLSWKEVPPTPSAPLKATDDDGKKRSLVDPSCSGANPLKKERTNGNNAQNQFSTAEAHQGLAYNGWRGGGWRGGRGRGGRGRYRSFS